MAGDGSQTQTPEVAPSETMEKETGEWSLCPECGMIWKDGREICEINGAGAATFPLHPVVGEEILMLNEKIVEDDGVLLRVLGVGFGHSKEGWFVKRWGSGQWLRTTYGRTPVALFRRMTGI